MIPYLLYVVFNNSTKQISNLYCHYRDDNNNQFQSLYLYSVTELVLSLSLNLQQHCWSGDVDNILDYKLQLKLIILFPLIIILIFTVLVYCRIEMFHDEHHQGSQMDNENV